MQHNSDRPSRSLFAFPWLLLAGAIAAAILLRVLVAQVYFVPSASMFPTLRSGDRVLIEKVSRLWRAPQRGDIVAFDGTDVWGSTMNGLVLAKRVIGVAGDHVMCCDALQRVRVNGIPLFEPYAVGHGRTFDITVPSGRIWLLGDNRKHSKDSSAFLGTSGGGSVPVNHVVGRMVAVVWPAARAGILGPPNTEDPHDAN
jgi:signal peptidase I